MEIFSRLGLQVLIIRVLFNLKQVVFEVVLQVQEEYNRE